MESVMVLNRNYEVLNYVHWHKALSLVMCDKAEVVHDTEQVVRSVYLEFKVPSVIRLIHSIVRPNDKIKFSRLNVFKRDKYKCQYCSRVFAKGSLTLDHVMPKSKGGKTNWENIVTACRTCNHRKGDKMPKEANMFPKRKPTEPKDLPMMRYVVTKRAEWAKYAPGVKVIEVDGMIE